jgi:TolB-like protein/AraC-like DNA-binding protein
VHNAFIQKLTNLVEKNLANGKFGPEELAREAGMSHSNLNRKLKTISNQNASLFIREVRLKKAKELLQNEELTAAEISYCVGFGSPTYFNKCFHEYFGYAPGEMRNHEHEEIPAEQPVETIPIKQNRTKILIGIAVILVVLVPSTYFLIKSIGKENIKDKSIAVLPFKYLSNDTPNQNQADAMMEAILQNLSKIKDLRVIGRTSVEQYRTSEKPAKIIGRELNVAYLLEGSFQKEGNQIRLIVQLIRTKDEDHVWSNNYDRNWEDIFSLQSEVAEKVANELQAAITPEEIQLIRKVPTINLTAYDFYQRGNEQLTKMWVDVIGDFKTAEKAQKFYLKALELDSIFALAYSGLAVSYYAMYMTSGMKSDNYLDSMFFLANKALSLDPQLAEAIMTRGDYYGVTGKQELAMKEYYKAQKLNPNDWMAYWNIGATLHDYYNDYVGSISNISEAIMRNRGPELPLLKSLLGEVFQNAGFIDQAKQCFEDRFKLTNDTSAYMDSKFWMLYANGNYEEAFLNGKNTGQRNPLWGFPLWRGDLLISILSGHKNESYNNALNAIEWVRKNNVNPIPDAHRIGYGLWVGGKQKEAEYYFNQQIENDINIIKAGRLETMRTAFYDIAAVYAFRGDNKKALQYLEKFNDRYSFPLQYVNLIKHDPLFNSIREEPRFQAILKDVEAKYQAEHEKVEKWLEEQGLI